MGFPVFPRAWDQSWLLLLWMVMMLKGMRRKKFLICPYTTLYLARESMRSCQVQKNSWWRRIGRNLRLRWRTIIRAQTIEQFDNYWLEFQDSILKPKTQQCVTYLQNEWLKEGQRERLVEAWTSQYLHFGIRVTSRGEGAHAYIKRYLGGKKSKGDLYSSWLHIEAAVINQITAVSTVRDLTGPYTC